MRQVEILLSSKIIALLDELGGKRGRAVIIRRIIHSVIPALPPIPADKKGVSLIMDDQELKLFQAYRGWFTSRAEMVRFAIYFQLLRGKIK